MKIGIISLGCPKNLLDSEVLLGSLQKKHTIVDKIEIADVVLINTCSFIEQAREESIQTILEIVELKRTGAIKYIVVCGCLPQKFADDLEREIPSIDAMIGTFTLDKISECIDALGRENTSKRFLSDKEPEDHYHRSRYFLTAPHAKYIKIAEGCDHHCSFCVIPQLRGHYRSRPMEAIVEEAELLVAAGTKEIILIAQDTSYYGVDRYKKKMLAELLRRVENVQGLRWLRVLYLYPNNIDDELIDVIAASPRICKYVDMPLQHINDTILKAMRRNITRGEIVRVIEKIRQKVPKVVLRTSMIVGYPGETYREFDELLKFVETTRFERLGAFLYSDEKDAHSFSEKDKVSDKVKRSRYQDLMLLQQDISRQVNAALIGTTMDVILDGESDAEPEFYSGRSYMDAPDIDCQILVKKQPGIKAGDLIQVKIKRGAEYDLEGEFIGFSL
jgi:ribosomal protein S12 methylthiotransferase